MEGKFDLGKMQQHYRPDEKIIDNISMTNRTGGGLLSDCCSQMSREVRMETG